MAGTVTIEAMAPVKVRFRAEGLAYELAPGERAELPRSLGDRLLAKAPGKVRVLTSEPATNTPDRFTVEPTRVAWPVCWENAKGQLYGPAPVEFLAEMDGHFWVCVTWKGRMVWVREDRLRLKASSVEKTGH